MRAVASITLPSYDIAQATANMLFIDSAALSTQLGVVIEGVEGTVAEGNGSGRGIMGESAPILAPAPPLSVDTTASSLSGTPNSESDLPTFALIVGVSGAGCLLVAVAICCWKLRARRRRRMKHSDKVADGVSRGRQQTVGTADASVAAAATAPAALSTATDMKGVVDLMEIQLVPVDAIPAETDQMPLHVDAPGPETDPAQQVEIEQEMADKELEEAAAVAAAEGVAAAREAAVRVAAEEEAAKAAEEEVVAAAARAAEEAAKAAKQVAVAKAAEQAAAAKAAEEAAAVKAVELAAAAKAAEEAAAVKAAELAAAAKAAEEAAAVKAAELAAAAKAAEETAAVKAAVLAAAAKAAEQVAASKAVEQVAASKAAEEAAALTAEEAAAVFADEATAAAADAQARLASKEQAQAANMHAKSSHTDRAQPEHQHQNAAGQHEVLRSARELAEADKQRLRDERKQERLQAMRKRSTSYVVPSVPKTNFSIVQDVTRGQASAQRRVDVQAMLHTARRQPLSSDTGGTGPGPGGHAGGGAAGSAEEEERERESSTYFV